MAVAVVPKEDCPHVENHISKVFEVTSVSTPCSRCNDAKENWICLECLQVNCSRYVKQDAENHYNETKHPIACSFSDLSIWCYECASYIKSPELQPLVKKLHSVKFAEKLEAKIAEEESDSDFDDTENKQVPVQEDDDSDEDEGLPLELLKRLLGVEIGGPKEAKANTCCIPATNLTLEGVADAIKEGKCKKIIVMTGAGISVAAGIPDFRTPGTGLYDNLQKYNLPHPTAVFELDYFRDKPEPFYLLAKELYPGNYKPTAAHYFIKLLHDKGILLRNFTQNIDTLERLTGIPGEKLVEAHGSFAESHCINPLCREQMDNHIMKEHVFASQVPRCAKCKSLVKPDIVFFGESLPARFFELMTEDFPECDLLIVIGTSLQVQPFASLIHKVPNSVPRVLINNEVVGKVDPTMFLYGLSRGFSFGLPGNYRDIAIIGDCQNGIKSLVEKIGWKDDLEKLINGGATEI